MIEPGAYVRVVRTTSPAVGHAGAVILVTQAEDAVLVGLETPFPVWLGGSWRRRSRVWCAVEEVEEVEYYLVGVDDTVRSGDPPNNLADARVGRRARVAR